MKFFIKYMDILIKNELQKISSSLNMKHTKKAAELITSAVSSNILNISDATTLKSILFESGIPLNENTILLAQNLLENDIPVNKETLTKLKQAIQMYNLQDSKETFLASKQKIDLLPPAESEFVSIKNTDKKTNIGEKQSFDLPKIIKQPPPNITPEILQKAIFALSNDIKINNANINAISKFAENKNFYSQLSEISNSLQFFEDVPIQKDNGLENEIVTIKEMVSKILISGRKDLFVVEDSVNSQPLKELLLQKFSLNFDEPKELINEKIQILYENLLEAIEFIETLENLDYKMEINNLKQTLVNTRDTCALIPLLKDSILIPFPINISGNIREAELYLIKDKGKNNKKKGSLNALLSLNMVNLGKIESYIQKEENMITIQFKLENIEVKSLIKREIRYLRILLGAYNLKSVTYLDLNEPFNLVKEIEIKAINNNYSSIDKSV